MKRSLLFLSLFCCSHGFAEFDLVLAKRHAEKLTDTTYFTHVAKRPGGGFYAVGGAGSDVALAKFSATGQVLLSRTYDSSFLLRDDVANVGVDAQDRLYVIGP